MSSSTPIKKTLKGISLDAEEFHNAFNKGTKWKGVCMERRKNDDDDDDDYGTRELTFLDLKGETNGANGTDVKEYIAEKILKGKLYYSRNLISDRRDKWEKKQDFLGFKSYDDIWAEQEGLTFHDACDNVENIDHLTATMLAKRQRQNDTIVWEKFILPLGKWYKNWKAAGKQEAAATEIKNQIQSIADCGLRIKADMDTFLKALLEKEKERLENELTKNQNRFFKKFKVHYDVFKTAGEAGEAQDDAAGSGGTSLSEDSNSDSDSEHEIKDRDMTSPKKTKRKIDEIAKSQKKEHKKKKKSRKNTHGSPSK